MADLVRFSYGGFDGFIEPPSNGFSRIYVLPMILFLPKSNHVQFYKLDDEYMVVMNFQMRSQTHFGTAFPIWKVIANSFGVPSAKAMQMAAQYQVNPVAPNRLSAQVECLGEEIGTMTEDDADAFVSTFSSWQIACKSLDKAAAQLILQGQFQLEVSYSVQLAKFQQLHVSIERKSFNTACVSAFKKLVTKASSSGGSFLFIDWSDTSYEEYMRASLNASGESSMESQETYFARDVTDPMLRQKLDSVMFDSLSETQFRANHEKAAAKASQLGLVALAALHTDYAKAVASKRTKDQVDTLKALAALSEGDVAGFLANGVAFGKSDGSTDYDISAISQAQFGITEKKNIEALLLESVSIRYLHKVGPYQFGLMDGSFFNPVPMKLPV